MREASRGAEISFAEVGLPNLNSSLLTAVIGVGGEGGEMEELPWILGSREFLTSAGVLVEDAEDDVGEGGALGAELIPEEEEESR